MAKTGPKEKPIDELRMQMCIGVPIGWINALGKEECKTIMAHALQSAMARHLKKKKNGK